ncbi:MAG: PAS domain-containing protein [Alphaproteobacteria bacterium]|nr:PAS domain-containing protein [Alphaproteobacteria bacterium]
MNPSGKNGTFFPSPFRRPVFVSLFLCLLWTIAALYAVTLYRAWHFNEAVSDDIKSAETLSTGIAIGIDHNLSLRRGIAITLAEESLVRKLAAGHCQRQHPVGPESEPVNRFLEVAEEHLGLNALWMGDAWGFGIAAARSRTLVSPLGVHYADRQYYREAKAGRVGFQYAFGRTTKIGGLYFSAPILLEGRFCGFILTKIDTSSLYPWIDQAEAVLADANGVIIAASDRNLEMRLLPGASVMALSEAERRQQYGRTDFQPLSVAPWKGGESRGLVRLEDQKGPMVMSSRNLESFPLSLTVFRPIGKLDEIDHDTRLLLPLAVGLGILVIIVLAASWGYLGYVKYSQALLRQKKQQLDEAQRLALLGSWERDMQAGQLTWSEECRFIFEGDADQETITADAFASRIHPDDRKAFEKAFRDSLEARQPGSFEHRLDLGGGRVKFVHQRWHCQFDGQGSPLRCYGFVQDITERKGLEEELRRSNAELEQFAYAASHDLREPLRMVSSFVSLLEKRYAGKLDQEAREFIGFARDGAKRMDALISGLLNYSRTGQSREPFQRVDLAQTLQEALLNLKATIEACRGQIEIETALPTVMGDWSELVRLFQNLVSNGLKYHAPDQTPVVRIGAERAGGEWVITVSDNGIGIAPEQHERIFRIFQKLHTPSQYEGAGIGLAVCKKIVEQHQGRIWVESQPGNGSRFSFTLPAME